MLHTGHILNMQGAIKEEENTTISFQDLLPTSPKCPALSSGLLRGSCDPTQITVQRRKYRDAMNCSSLYLWSYIKVNLSFSPAFERAQGPKSLKFYNQRITFCEEPELIKSAPQNNFNVYFYKCWHDNQVSNVCLRITLRQIKTWFGVRYLGLKTFSDTL